MAMSDVVRLRENLVRVLYRQCELAFGPSGFTMLTVIEGAQTRVSLSSCDSTVRDASPFARAQFVVEHERIEALVDIGVPIGELATAAFRDLLGQLAAAAPNRVEFMRGVQSRMLAAVVEESRILDEVHGDTFCVQDTLTCRKIGKGH